MNAGTLPSGLRIARTLLLASAALASTAPSVRAAARGSDDALSLVPPDSASVAVVRWSELRSSPLAARLLADADHLTVDGDAARFLAEAHLRPQDDVDTAVFAGAAPSGDGTSSGLAIFEGRFDPESLSNAVASRGGVFKPAGGAGYYLLPSRAGRSGAPGAIAFASPRLIVAGSEGAVVAALATRQAGGTAFASGAGLGRHLSRVDPASSLWALVDVARYPAVQRGLDRKRESAAGQSETSTALLSAMKSVSLFAFEARARGDALELTATGLTADEDTRSLLEDSLRGVLAMWRLAVQDRSPELVSVLRQFKVSRNGEGVTISGTLSGSALRALGEKKQVRRQQD